MSTSSHISTIWWGWIWNSSLSLVFLLYFAVEFLSIFELCLPFPINSNEFSPIVCWSVGVPGLVVPGPLESGFTCPFFLPQAASCWWVSVESAAAGHADHAAACVHMPRCQCLLWGNAAVTVFLFRNFDCVCHRERLQEALYIMWLMIDQLVL